MPARYKQNYDAQVTIQFYAWQKRLLVALLQGRLSIPGKRYAYLGDIFREALEDWLAKHHLDESTEVT